MQNTRRPGHTPYLVRYVLCEKPEGRVYIHNHVGPDPEDSFHDHPWHGYSFILLGGYTEQVCQKTIAGISQPIVRHHKRGDLNELKIDEYHRITAVEPNTWTLFMAGPYVKSWGFLQDDGKHVDWIEHQFGVIR